MTNTTFTSLSNAPLFPVCYYISAFSTFFTSSNLMTINDKNQSVPVINALFQYFKTSENESLAKSQLLRTVLTKGNYQGGDNTTLDMQYVNKTYQYIINVGLFHHYGNVTKYLSGNRNGHQNETAKEILQHLSEEYIDNNPCSSENGSTKLTPLAIEKLLDEYIWPFLEGPQTGRILNDRNENLTQLERLKRQSPPEEDETNNREAIQGKLVNTMQPFVEEDQNGNSDSLNENQDIESHLQSEQRNLGEINNDDEDSSENQFFMNDIQFDPDQFNNMLDIIEDIDITGMNFDGSHQRIEEIPSNGSHMSEADINLALEIALKNENIGSVGKDMYKLKEHYPHVVSSDDDDDGNNDNAYLGDAGRIENIIISDEEDVGISGRNTGNHRQKSVEETVEISSDDDAGNPNVSSNRRIGTDRNKSGNKRNATDDTLVILSSDDDAHESNNRTKRRRINTRINRPEATIDLVSEDSDPDNVPSTSHEARSRLNQQNQNSQQQVVSANGEYFREKSALKNSPTRDGSSRRMLFIQTVAKDIRSCRPEYTIEEFINKLKGFLLQLQESTTRVPTYWQLARELCNDFEVSPHYKEWEIPNYQFIKDVLFKSQFYENLTLEKIKNKYEKLLEGYKETVMKCDLKKYEKSTELRESLMVDDYLLLKMNFKFQTIPDDVKDSVKFALNLLALRECDKDMIENSTAIYYTQDVENFDKLEGMSADNTSYTFTNFEEFSVDESTEQRKISAHINGLKIRKSVMFKINFKDQAGLVDISRIYGSNTRRYIIPPDTKFSITDSDTSEVGNLKLLILTLEDKRSKEEKMVEIMKRLEDIYLRNK